MVRVVVDGEAPVWFAGHGSQHLFSGITSVGVDAAVIAVVDGGDVPGMSRVAAAGLAHVGGSGVQAVGSEEMHLGPGSALGAVDRARPGVRDVRAPVGAATADEPAGQEP